MSPACPVPVHGHHSMKLMRTRVNNLSLPQQTPLRAKLCIYVITLRMRHMRIDTPHVQTRSHRQPPAPLRRVRPRLQSCSLTLYRRAPVARASGRLTLTLTLRRGDHMRLRGRRADPRGDARCRVPPQARPAASPGGSVRIPQACPHVRPSASSWLPDELPDARCSGDACCAERRARSAVAVHACLCLRR